MRSGIPTIAEIEGIFQDQMLLDMLAYNERFVQGNRRFLNRLFRNRGSDPMRHLGRRWEYPFAGYRIKEFSTRNSERRIRILDAGSGITFFPYYLCERLGAEQVVCCDCDPSYAKVFATINRRLSQGSVRFKRTMLQELPFPDESFDAITCISVLEHTDNYAEVLREFRRVLRREGLLVLTFDVSLDGRTRISREEATELLREIERIFGPGKEIDYLKELRRLDRPEECYTTDYVRNAHPELLPWKYPRLKSLYDFLKGRGWSGGFYSVSCFCLVAGSRGEE